MDLLYQMLRETHTLNPRKLVTLLRDDGSTLLSLSTTLTHLFPLLPNTIDNTLTVEFTEKACAMLYELFQAMEQTRWQLLAGRFSVSTAWLVEGITAEDKMVSDMI